MVEAGAGAENRKDAFLQLMTRLEALSTAHVRAHQAYQAGAELLLSEPAVREQQLGWTPRWRSRRRRGRRG